MALSAVHKLWCAQSMGATAPAIKDITGARCLLNLGDSITTDHISPAGNIAKDSPAARYLMERGVERKDFNTYGARRGNDEVRFKGACVFFSWKFGVVGDRNRMLGTFFVLLIMEH